MLNTETTPTTPVTQLPETTSTILTTATAEIAQTVSAIATSEAPLTTPTNHHSSSRKRALGCQTALEYAWDRLERSDAWFDMLEEDRQYLVSENAGL